MKTIDTPDSINAGRFVDHHGSALIVAAAVVSMLLMAMSVNAKDVRTADPQGVPIVQTIPVAPSMSPEQAWNELEAVQAALSVGMPTTD